MTVYVAGAMTGFGLGLLGLAAALAVIGHYNLQAATAALAGVTLSTVGYIAWRALIDD